MQMFFSGVHTVVVALIAAKADVSFDANKTSVEGIIEELDRLGYPARLPFIFMYM